MDVKPLDIKALRTTTPACEDVLHLDHAGSSLPSEAVQRVVRTFLDHEARVGGYRAADEARDALGGFYDEAARMLNASAEEIAFQPSATAAWTAAVQAVGLGAGDEVLVHRAAYGSNGITWLKLREQGIVISVIDSDADGLIDLNELALALRRRPKLVALTHIGTNSGGIQPAAEVGALCRAAGVWFLLDACQSVGQLALNVDELKCDLLSFTGRKYLRGPRGTGGLYVRRTLLDEGFGPLFPDLLGSDWKPGGHIVLAAGARRFETFERHVAGQLGLAEAIREGNHLGWTAIEARIVALGASLRARLADAGAMVQDDGRRQGGIVTFTLPEGGEREVHAALRRRDIHVSVSHAQSARWHMEARGLTRVLRASVHALNTEDELERFVSVLAVVRKSMKR